MLQIMLMKIHFTQLKGADNDGLVNYTEFSESTESAENYNCLSSLIKQPKNYSSTCSDAFSQILSVKNHSSFYFPPILRFCLWPYILKRKHGIHG